MYVILTSNDVSLLLIDISRFIVIFLRVDYFSIFFIHCSSFQDTSVENANAVPMVTTAFLVFRTANAFHAIVTWQEV